MLKGVLPFCFLPPFSCVIKFDGAFPRPCLFARPTFSFVLPLVHEIMRFWLRISCIFRSLFFFPLQGKSYVPFSVLISPSSLLFSSSPKVCVFFSGLLLLRVSSSFPRFTRFLDRMSEVATFSFSLSLHRAKKDSFFFSSM